MSRDVDVGSVITYSIAACLSRPAEIGELSEWMGSTLDVVSIWCEGGGGDLECVTVIGAGGAKGEGEMDAVADGTAVGAGRCCCFCRDMAVRDDDLDFRTKINKVHHENPGVEK
jgi:hypothetical protein